MSKIQQILQSFSKISSMPRTFFKQGDSPQLVAQLIAIMRDLSMKFCPLDLEIKNEVADQLILDSSE